MFCDQEGDEDDMILGDTVIEEYTDSHECRGGSSNLIIVMSTELSIRLDRIWAERNILRAPVHQGGRHRSAALDVSHGCKLEVEGVGGEVRLCLPRIE